MCGSANERKFASALVGLDSDAVMAWAERNGKTGATIEQLANDDQVKAEIQASVDELNAGLNRWETIKKFRILPKELTIEDGELTPSMKVKRKVVQEQFADVVDEMYA